VTPKDAWRCEETAARVARFLPFLVLSLSALLVASSVSVNAADLYLEDEREIYLALDKMNGMGLLPGFLANTRPYDMQAVRAAIDHAPNAGYGESQSGAAFADWVSFYSHKGAVLRGTATLSWADRQAVPRDDGGGSVPKGVSAGLSALARYEPSSWASADLKGSSVFETGGGRSRVEESSVEFGYKYISLQAGKITTWYGPGRGGALIFTNNAQPYPGVRLHNPVPIPAPGIFSFLGNVQYDLFVARLDADRPVPHSLLSGMRLAARPSRFLELGVSRAFQFGGEGRDESLSTFLHVLTGRRESAGNTPVGNSLASVDAALLLPFRLQPLSLYLEWGGEDQSQPFVFTRRAWLGGVFLPSIGGVENADLRIEYGTTRTNEPGVWYRHFEYPHEYRGTILGHPMGTDARELWLQGHWFFLPSTFLELTVIRTGRQFPGPATETTNSCEAAFIGWFTRSLRARAGFQAERVANAGGVADRDENNFTTRLELSWQFSGSDL
jgi:Capsule assembly protein Wzi